MTVKRQHEPVASSFSLLWKMTSIDELFKSSGTTNGKRKPTYSSDPTRHHKVLKLGQRSDPDGKAQVADHNSLDVSTNGFDGVEEEDDGMAGPERPPDHEIDEPDNDDEEGRFFGGGVNNDTAEVLDIIEERDKEEFVPDKFDISWLRKTALNFERKISRNAELRAKYEDDPQKFMKSEADLDNDIKALSILSEHSDLYPEFAKLGSVNSLATLLSHENTDISIDAIEIISELTAEDVEAEPEAWNALVDALLEADLLDLLSQNLERLDENNDADKSGVYHSLSLLENLASQSSVSEKIGKTTTLLQWLLQRAERKESHVGQNKQYAAEVLAILLQTSPASRKKLTEIDGIDKLLQLLSAYRKRDPAKESNEEEYMENLFDCITCLVDEVDGKGKFTDAEGIELCLIMLREGGQSKVRALRLLDHALNGQDSSQICERFVDAAGLRTVFGMFMRKQDSQTTEHLLGIFAALLRHLPGDSSARIRALAKFIENDYAKVDKLLKMRQNYSSKLATIDDIISKERSGMDKNDQDGMAGEWLSRRLDAGLFELQTVDLILAWLIAEDDGAKKRIKTLLADRNKSLAIIHATLQEQVNDLQAAFSEEEQNTREMLQTLMSFLA